MTTVYKLKEICKWSVGHPRGEHRYVDITVTYKDANGTQAVVCDTLELPSACAVRLCEAMRAVAPSPAAPRAVTTTSSTLIASLFARQWIERTCRIKRYQDGKPFVFDLSCPSTPLTETWKRNRSWVLNWLNCRERDTDTVQAAADLGWSISFDSSDKPEVMFVPLFVTPDVSEHA